MKLLQELEYPDFSETRSLIMRPHLHTLQLNNEVVVGEYWPKKMYIWNLETGDRVILLFNVILNIISFGFNIKVWERKLDIDITKIHYNCRGIRLRGRKLLSYSATPAKNPVDENHIYSHKFYLLELTEEGKVKNERLLILRPSNCRQRFVDKDFDFDETRVVIFFYDINQAYCDVRCSNTGDSLFKVAVPETACDYHRFFVYSDGLVMTGLGAYELR